MTTLTPPLFKFRSLAGFARAQTLDTIRHRRLWFAEPQDFNDPFDCAPVVVIEGSNSELRSYIRTLTRDRMPYMAKQDMKRQTQRATISDPRVARALAQVREAQQRGYGVCSFSKSPYHPLLWAHYSDAHRGICLEFAAPIPKRDSLLSMALPVQYSSERPVINLLALRQGTELLEKAVLTKAECWRYEQEYRCIDVDAAAGLRAYPMGALRRVIFGYACPPEDREAVKVNARRGNPGVIFAEALMADRTFDLEIVPVTG